MLTPFAYQTNAANLIAASSRAIYNMFEPGLGKSCVALLVAKRKRAKRVLIVCPLSAVYSWKLELAKFWPEHPKLTIINGLGDTQALQRDGVFIVTYGLLSRSISLVDWIKAAAPMDMSILDEAHALKNAKALRTRAVLAELKPNLGLAHPMSATPTPNHAGELWPILRTLRPDLIVNGARRPMSQAEFEDRYCKIKQIRVKTRTGDDRLQRVIVGSKNVDELRTRLQGFFIRETKANVLKELPPLDFVTVPIPISEPERFQTIGQLIESGVDDDDILEHAAMVANSTRYRELGFAKASMVAEYVRDMLDGGVKQVVVWAVHHDVLDYLVKHLLDYGVSALDGRMASKERAIAIENFVEGHTRVFVGQIQAGGMAITLSGGKLPCRDIVFAETSFSPSDNFQAACRIHRIGQRDAVLARFASAAETYDDRIQDILARKTKDFTELFEGAI
jgi:SWI/SNF-related matrix-associated actin-dependent regulator of chromatin subfamily A-like protein 1